MTQIESDMVAQLFKDEETIKQLTEELNKYKKIVHAIFPDKFQSYFICGESGEKDSNDLPESIHVCPAYGCDWFQIYTLTERTMGPEW